MSDPVFIVQNDQVTRATAPVAAYARRHGIALVDVSGNAASVAVPGPVLFAYGSVRLLSLLLRMPAVAARLSWSAAAVTASAWRDRYGADYVGAAGRVVSSSEVGELIARDGPLAVRPNVGMKQFRGGVYSDWPVAGAFDCFVVPPSTIEMEARVWFVAGRAVAGSLYLPHPTLDGVGEAIKAADRIARRKGLPLDTIVMDIGLTPDGWKIVEFNAIHTAGWYCADPDEVLDAVLAAERQPAYT